MVSELKKFKKIGIFSSIKGKKVNEIALQIKEILESMGLDLYLSQESFKDLMPGSKNYSDNYLLKNSELIIAIGGDGTLLSCSRKFGINGIPILGVNLGNLGFLTDIQPSEITTSLRRVLDGEYYEDKRIFLKANSKNIQNEHTALNEIVIHSGSIAQLIEYELFLNEDFVYRQRADGLIISTSTGSTAYSLSGNGPIIHPSLRAITLLPMFPHSLNSRPLIVDENTKIEIRLCGKNRAYLSADSHNNSSLKQGSSICVSKSEEELSLIHPIEHDFYSACRNKLGWSLGIKEKNDR